MSVGYQTGESISSEFEQINGNISSNIYKIKQNNTELLHLARLIGTNKDTIQLRDRISNTIDESTKLIGSTNNYFKQLNNKKWSKDEVTIIGRSKKNFKNEGETFSRLSKDVTEKLRLTTPVSEIQNKSLISFQDDETNESTKLLQQQKENDLNKKLESIQDREQRIQNIESDIIDVNVIMKELASLVNEQTSIIDNISTNIESTYSNVETANDELTKASKYASKYRKKVFILILIALVVCITLAIIIYFSIKK